MLLKFNSSSAGTFPDVVGASGLGLNSLFEHEVGTDQLNPDNTVTTLTSFATSFDFPINTQQGTGEVFPSYEKIFTRL